MLWEASAHFDGVQSRRYAVGLTVAPPYRPGPGLINIGKKPLDGRICGAAGKSLFSRRLKSYSRKVASGACHQ